MSQSDCYTVAANRVRQSFWLQNQNEQITHTPLLFHTLSRTDFATGSIGSLATAAGGG